MAWKFYLDRDASSDLALSTFGVMFAPNQAKAANELLRVCTNALAAALLRYGSCAGAMRYNGRDAGRLPRSGDNTHGVVGSGGRRIVTARAVKSSRRQSWAPSRSVTRATTEHKKQHG
jgi:hypothetical protein